MQVYIYALLIQVANQEWKRRCWLLFLSALLTGIYD